MRLWFLFFLIVNASNLIDKILSVNEPKDGKIRPTFDEIYGKGWDDDDHQQIKVETSPLNSGENALNEQADHDDNIDQDVEAYNLDSTDQNLTQEDPDRFDQSDDETIEGINAKNECSEQEKREIISKFHAMREEFKKNGKFPATEMVKIECKIGNKLGVYRKKIYKWKKEFGIVYKHNSHSEQEKREIISNNALKEEYKKTRKLPEIKRVKIECKIGKKLGVNRKKIYKWKKEFGLSHIKRKNKNSFYEKKKREFIARIKEIKMCQRGEQNKLMKDLGICRDTFIKWKKEFGLPVNSQFKHSDSEKLELMEKYYKIKQINPKLNVIDIAKRLNISPVTLYKWKKQFDSNLNKNSVNENSLPENSPTFTDNDTSEHPMPSSDDNLWAWNLVKKKRTERIQVDTLREEIKTK